NRKIKPLVIGSSISPRALFRINYDTLPVIYRANSILLLVDNASLYFHNQSNIANINELHGSDKSNVNSEKEIFDNNLEPEISITLYGNQRGRGRPRLTTTNQDSSNSRGKHGNHSNR
ncbi:11666_t:CDS:2, partial [Gigaspora rosea]